ncbi:MAG: DUF6600 domain-containing protein [Ignavibacteriaceae bacterium]
MKKKNAIKFLSEFTIIISGILLVAASGCSQVQQVQSPNTYSTNPGSYYQNNGNYDQTLNEYGDWIAISPYGNVWKPFVVSTWQPYNYGYWVYSNYGWTWVSYEPFGWIVYHYGFWIDNPDYGWLWVPSNDQWSPARVDWYDYGNYVCWAPQQPHGISYGAPWISQRHVWHVVQNNNFTQKDLTNYYITRSMLRNNIGSRSVISRRPPDITEIRTRAAGTIPIVKIEKQNITRGNGQIVRMRLPVDQQRIVQQHTLEIQRTVIQHRNLQPQPIPQKQSQNNSKKAAGKNIQPQIKRAVIHNHQPIVRRQVQNKTRNASSYSQQQFHRPGQYHPQTKVQRQHQHFAVNRQLYNHRQRFHRSAQYHPQTRVKKQPQHFAVNRSRYNHQQRFHRPVQYHPQTRVQKQPQHFAVNRSRYNHRQRFHRPGQYHPQPRQQRHPPNHASYAAGRRNGSSKRF